MSEAIKKTDENVAIEFRHVTKIYKLFANDKQRFKAIFFKGVPCHVFIYRVDFFFNFRPRPMPELVIQHLAFIAVMK